MANEPRKDNLDMLIDGIVMDVKEFDGDVARLFEESEKMTDIKMLLKITSEILFLADSRKQEIKHLKQQLASQSTINASSSRELTRICKELNNENNRMRIKLGIRYGKV